MEQYAIVYYPKIDIKKIQLFRKKYDPQYGVIKPHITIVFPFSDISEKQIVIHIETAIKQIKPFEISLHGL